MTRPEPTAALERALAPMHRRAFLRGVAAASAAGLVPLGCRDPELGPPADRSLRVLSPRAYATLNAAAARLLGPPAEVLIQTRRVDPAARADDWLGETPALGAVLGQGLLALELGVWPLLPKLRPFTTLAGPAQDAVLASCMGSRLDLKRDLFKGVKSVAALAFYGEPASHRAIGYPGPFGTARDVAAAMAWSPDP